MYGYVFWSNMEYRWNWLLASILNTSTKDTRRDLKRRDGGDSGTRTKRQCIDERDKVTSPGYIEREICGVTTRIETPIEIVVKKVFYRASELTQRDAIDIALVLEKMPSVAFSTPLLWAKREALAVRLRFLASHFDRFAIALKPGYEHLAKESVQILESWLKRTDAFPADLGPGPRGNLGSVDRR